MVLAETAPPVGGPVKDELFRLMVECVTDYAIFMLDPGGRISTWNPGARRLKGWEAEEIIGRHFSAFYPPEDVAAGKPDRELVEAAGVGRFEDEGWRLRKDGSRFWANVVITALRDREGVLRGFGKVTRDLTERKAAEEAARRAAAERARAEEQARAAEAVRHSEEQLRTLADSIPHLVWISGADGRVRWFNRRWYDYTGLSADAVVEADHRREVVHPEDLQRTLPAWSEALAAGRPWEGELRLRRRDGVFRWHLARALPVRDAQGRISGWFGTSTDVEEHQRAMAELRRAEEEAREIGRLQERLVAIVGHDLRTPLQVIHLGVSTALRSAGLSPELERTLGRVARSAQRMRGIIDDLLDFSRARQGQGIPVAKGPLDLAEVCRRALAELAPLSGGRTLSLEVHGDTALEGDAGRLLQVASNLVGNAVQHGTGPVEVDLRGDGDEVTLEVRNGGPAIAPEVLPHLFEPFRRGGGEGSDGSIGLGLFIVREVVRAHGGAVEVRSDEGGTAFTVRLPRGVAGAARAPAGGAGADAPA